MKYRVLRLARHPSIYKIPCFNFCSAMEHSYYVFILLKTPKGTTKTVHNETFNGNDCSEVNMVWFSHVHLQVFLLLKKLFGK